MDLQNTINQVNPALMSASGPHGWRRPFLVAVLGILVLKLAVDLLVVPHFKNDIKSLYSIGHVDNYYSIAKSIENGDGYRFTPDTALTVMREPGYPYFLAFLRGIPGDYQRLSTVVNIFLSSLCAVLIFSLAKGVTSIPSVPVIASILFMLHPGVVLGELRNGVEIPFTLLLLVFLVVLRKALLTDSIRGYLKAGLVLGVVSLTRSTALLFPSFLLFYGFIFNGGWRSIPRSVGKIALIMLAAFLVLSPWIIRNYNLVGKFIPTASVQGIAMQAGEYICIHEGGSRTFEQLDQDAADVRNELATQQGYRFKPYYYQYFFDTKDEVKFNSSLAGQVVSDYIHSPSRFVRCAADNVFNFWFQGKNRTATLANIAIQLPYMVLAMLGIWMGFKQIDKPALALLLLFVAYTMGVYVPIHAQARYSIPLMPILAIFAAIPLALLLTRLRGSARLRAGARSIGVT
jgi:hypothetical protein